MTWIDFAWDFYVGKKHWMHMKRVIIRKKGVLRQTQSIGRLP